VRAVSDAAFTPGFRSLDSEVTDYHPPVEGSVPDWLDGRLIRNGPGRFGAGDDRVDHWFDGLALLRSYDFADGDLTYSARFLRTEAYAESEAGGGRAGGFATGAQGWRKVLGWLRRFGPPSATDNANVHVARIDGRVTALTEVPRWTAFDADTLETRGELAFADDLSLDTTTAHLARDPFRKEHVGFGVDFGRTHHYRLYRIPDGTRRREEIAAIPTDAPAYIHDCAVTRRFVVLVEVPLRIAVWRAFSPTTGGFLDLLDWQPDRGTRLLVVDRDTGDLAADPVIDPVFTFHTVNAYETGDTVVLDLVEFADADIVDALGFETLRTEGFGGVPTGPMVRYRVPVGAGADGPERGEPVGDGVTREPLYDGGMELPTVPRTVRGRPYRYAYGQATDREGANGLVRVDTETGAAREWWERGCYVEEPRVVRPPDADPRDGQEDEGVVLAPVLDTDRERTRLMVFDAATLEELARAPLPHAEPFGFHGRFFSRR